MHTHAHTCTHRHTQRHTQKRQDNVNAEPRLPPLLLANLVLQSTTERIFATTTTTDANDPQPKGLYADKAHGIFLVRGENVLLLGEIDLDKDDEPPAGFEQAEFDTVEKLLKEKRAAEKVKEKNRLRKLATHGFEGENLGEILL